MLPGEIAGLLTDGIVEAHGPPQELFGIERVLQLVKANKDRTAREILNCLYGAIRDFCGPQAQPDDMTAIIIKASGADVSR